MPGSILGNAVRRREDPRLVSGSGRYVDDLAAERGLYAVFARSPHAHARLRGAEAVVADYDPLPVIATPEAAAAEGAPILFPQHGSNVAFETAVAGDGDVLAGADVVVSGRIVNQRLAAVPMEPDGALAEP